MSHCGHASLSIQSLEPAGPGSPLCEISMLFGGPQEFPPLLSLYTLAMSAVPVCSLPVSGSALTSGGQLAA